MFMGCILTGFFPGGCGLFLFWKENLSGKEHLFGL